MKKRRKKYKQAIELIDKSKVYEAKEACELVKKTNTTKFDASVDVSFHLNIDTKHAEQQIRGAIVLPHGTGKNKTVLAITTKEAEAKAAAAKAAKEKAAKEKAAAKKKAEEAKKKAEQEAKTDSAEKPAEKKAEDAKADKADSK